MFIFENMNVSFSVGISMNFPLFNAHEKLLYHPERYVKDRKLQWSDMPSLYSDDWDETCRYYGSG